MKVKIMSIVTDILLIDIIGFSKLSDEEQLISITILNNHILDFLKLICGQSFIETKYLILSLIPTGDGFYIILNPAFSGYGPLLAVSLRSSVFVFGKKNNYPFKGIRVACNFGVALPFKDIIGNINYIGSGMNDCARILNLNDVLKKEMIKFSEGEDFVVISQSAYNQFNIIFPFEKFKDYFNAIKLRFSDEKSFFDKHGKEHKIYFMTTSKYVSIQPPMSKEICGKIRNFEKKMAEINNYCYNIRNDT